MSQNDNTNAIDAAIAAAKARKAAKNNADSASEAAPGEDKPARKVRIVTPKEEKPVKESKRARLSDEEKAARKAAKDAERAEKKVQRQALRAEKQAAKSANKKPAHMEKVVKAASRLPGMSEQACRFLDEVTVNLSAADLTALAMHIQHFNRVKATERALSQKIAPGDTVRIVGGDPRFVGQTGTVSKAQRIRCYVEIPGVNKPVYLFTSDVETISEIVATGTNG
jgi:transcription antitermination factor NusG